MRHYDLEAYHRTVARVFGGTAVPHSRWVVDEEAAVFALRESGGPPERRLDDRADAAAKAARLLIALIQRTPVIVAGRNNTVALAATADYLAVRGYRLELLEQGVAAVLMNQIEDDRLSHDEVRRALLNVLTPVEPVIPRSARALQSRRLCISHAVSCPTRQYASAAALLRRHIDRQLTRLGAEVLLPQPRPAGDGQRGGGHRPQPTEDLFRRSMARLTRSDALIVVDDPGGRGSAIESDYAKRLAMPLFTLRLDGIVRAYESDGWNVVIDVDPTDPDDGARRALSSIRKYGSRIHDFAAYRRSVEYKNQDELSRLRGCWEALDRPQREVAVELAQLPAPRIDAYLSNGLALELASHRERRNLKIALQDPPERPRGLHSLRPEEMDYLGQAGADLGLDQGALLRAASAVVVRMSGPFGKRRLRSVEDARTVLAECLESTGEDHP